MILNALVSAPGEAGSIIKSRAEPSRAEPSRAEPSRAEPSRAEPSRAEPSRAEPSRAEPSRAEPSRAEPSRAEPSRAEPSRAEPSRAEPSRAEPSRAEPSRAEPSRAEPSRAEPSRAEPSRAGWPPDALPFAPRGAPSEPLPTEPAVPAPPSRRRGPAAGDRHRHGGRRGRVLGAWIERAAAALLSGSAAIRDDASTRGRTFPASGGETRRDARRRAVAAVPVWVLLGFAALLLACAATLGADAASAADLITNNGQTTSSNYHNLANHDVAQSFKTGATGATTYGLDSIQVRFNSTPSATATVTAIVADGRGAGSTVIATLTNPASWSTITTFTAPAGTTLASNTTYHLIIDASEGELQATSGNGENTGGANGWSIGDSRYRRSATTDSGVGGTWASSADALKIRVQGTIIAPSTEARLFDLQVANGTFSPAFNSDYVRLRRHRRPHDQPGHHPVTSPRR